MSRYYVRNGMHYGTADEMIDRIEELEAQRDEAVKALIDLERCATRVDETRGILFGPQGMKLHLAIHEARFVLEKMPTPLKGGKDE